MDVLNKANKKCGGNQDQDCYPKQIKGSMGKSVHPGQFRIDKHITLPLAFFALVMDDAVSGHFVCSLAEPAKSKRVESVSVSAFRTGAKLIIAGFVDLGS